MNITIHDMNITIAYQALTCMMLVLNICLIKTCAVYRAKVRQTPPRTSAPSEKNLPRTDVP